MGDKGGLLSVCRHCIKSVTYLCYKRAWCIAFGKPVSGFVKCFVRYVVLSVINKVIIKNIPEFTAMPTLSCSTAVNAVTEF